MRLRRGLPLAGLMVASVALAQNFWVKEYTQWTDSEVRKLLIDSPWAAETKKAVAMAVLMQSRNTADRGGGPGAVAPRGLDRGQGSAQIEITLRISWQSALPIRMAFVRSRVGPGAAVIPPDMEQLLKMDPQEYIILVTGMPIRQARAIETTAASKKSSIHVGKRPPILARSTELQPRSETVDVVLRFPRSQPITLDDKEIEVFLTLGPVEAKKKFTLKDMVYNGKLEL